MMTRDQATTLIALLVAIDEIGNGRALAQHMEEGGIENAEDALEALREAAFIASR